MDLIRFLLKKSWGLMCCSIAAGLISGLAGAGLIAVIHRGMNESPVSASLAWSFLGLAVAVAVCKALSEILLTRLGQSTISELRYHLSRRILDAPLGQLDRLGHHRLLAALSEDTDVIAQAYVQLPLIGINVATTIGLSGLPRLVVVADSAARAERCMALGALTFQWQERKAIGSSHDPARPAIALFGISVRSWRGSRSSSCTASRRHAFLDHATPSHTVKAYERDFVGGMTVYSIASSWGLLSVLRRHRHGLVPLAVMARRLHRYGGRATLVLLYMMGPFSQIVELLPGVGRANVALNKIDALGLSLALHRRRPARSRSGDRDRRPSWISAVEPARPDRSLRHHHAPEGDERPFLHRSHRSDFPARRGDVSGRRQRERQDNIGPVAAGTLSAGIRQHSAWTVFRSTTANRDTYRQLFSTVFCDFHLFDSLLGLEQDESGRGGARVS
jgi:putative ATP-binding cassette transporter